ncbi:MAG: Xaa-Pro peptidase family protein [Calditrichia bacterium]
MLIQEKVLQAKNLLREMNIDCWITFVRESQINGDPTLAFLVETDLTWHSAFVFTAAGEAHAIVGAYDQKSVEDLGAYDSVTGYVTGFKEPLLKLLQSFQPQQIALNFSESSEICDGITHGMYLTLKNSLREVNMSDRIISAEPLVSALRERKSATELDYMKQAIHHTETIFEKVAGFISPGKTEKEIAAFMKNEVEKAGLELAWEPAVCPAVFTGPETAGAHYAPTNRRVEPGHVLNMDFGVKVNGYCSDMQRTFYILKSGEQEAPLPVKKGFNTIVKAIEESRKTMRPGVAGREIDRVARGIVTEAGYQEFPHALGHQVGRYSHDGTALLGPEWEKYANKPHRPLENEMVFTLEPRLTVENHGVVTIEEMAVVKQNGAEYMSRPQKELILIR